MAKEGSSGENYQPPASWMERKARVRKPTGKGAPTTTWRRRTPRHTPRKKVLSISSDNVESSPPEAMVSKGEDPLMIMASSTGYSTDTFERDEEHFLKDLEKPKTPRKVMSTKPAAHKNSPSRAKVASFAFQKRLARIDWRTVHTIDVGRVIREVDIDTLETVLDTIAFGDIQGEDTRNFTEANFVKIFRLAQLMVEYLLHVQELLADHKAELLQAGATMQQKSEKIRSRFLWQRNSLLQTRHELKQAKKTLKTYEVMLKIQGKTQNSQISQPQVRHCPFCEKVFESPYYLDLHVARRHQKRQEVTEDRILAVVSKAEEATAARVKTETSLAVQAEIQQLREKYQEDLQRAETTSNTQVRSLQTDLKQSNNQLHDVQTRLEILQAQILSASPNRLYDLESKFTGLEHQVKTLGQENSRLLKQLNVAYAEVSELQSAKRQKVFALENQVDDLRKENQHLKRTMSKDEEPIVLSLFKERRGSSPRERWTREPDKDQALLALARPTAERRKAEAVSAHNNEEPSEQGSSPEPEHYRHSTSPVKRAPRVVPQEVKYETSPERMRKSAMQRPKSAAVKKGKPRGDESPTTVEEMRAKLEREMAVAHEEQKRRQKAVQRLLAKEIEKEKLEEKKRGKRTKGENARSCKPATQYPHTSKSESPCESDDEVEKRTTPHEDEKVNKIQEIAEVAAMDVGEDVPSIPIPEKQKWLTEHPFVPIPTLPHVVAKYPHPETVFEKAHKEIANEFDGQLREELNKFGIASNKNGISDNTYNSISSALEKQRLLRMSQIHGSERKVMEYERGAIVWHTQRAVHDRDMEIIESQFDVASNSGSDHLSDGSVSEDSGDESGKSNYNSSRSHQSHKSDESDPESREDEMKPLGASHMRSSEHSSPQSSEIGGSSDDLQEAEALRKNELVVNRVKHPVASKTDGREYSGPRSPPDGRVQYVSRAFSWKQKQAQTTRSSRDFLSREPVRPDAEDLVNGRQSELGEDQVEEELGLGDWESDEDAVPSRGKQRRVKILDRQLASVLEDSPPRDLSPPKELMDMHQLKSSMASTSYKPTPPPSSPKSSTATVSAENTCRANPQKPIPGKSAPVEKDEALGKIEDCTPKDETEQLTENDESDGSDGSDVEENKIFKELTSEIDEIISL